MARHRRRVIKQLDSEHPVDIVPTSLGAHVIPEEYRSRPDDYVALVIDAMIPHHQSAIDAGQMALPQATRQEIRDLAAVIIADQQREIDQMTSWRQSWYATSTPPEVIRDQPMNMPGMGH